MQSIKERPKTLIEYKDKVLTIMQGKFDQKPHIIQIDDEDISKFLDLLLAELAERIC
jgi:hypothetical protein